MPIAADTPMTTSRASRGILRLDLQTTPLDDMRRFYTETLLLPLRNSSPDAFTLHAGDTLLTFSRADRDPYYHFAFNIPENMLHSAMVWTRARLPLLRRPDGRDVYDFVSWNAHAFYFLDPAGNVVEFIARHDLRNARDGDFSQRDILHASEIGIVVDDVPSAARAARDSLALDRFRGSSGADFTAVGDDHALLIFVRAGRNWNAIDRAAAVFPASAVIAGKQNGCLVLPGTPYRVDASAD